jgi:hypothetical protein
VDWQQEGGLISQRPFRREIVSLVPVSDGAAKFIREFGRYIGIGEAPTNEITPLFAPVATTVGLEIASPVKFEHRIKPHAEAAFRHGHLHNVGERPFNMLGADAKFVVVVHGSHLSELKNLTAGPRANNARH